MVNQAILDDMEVARDILLKTGCSIVVIKNGKTLSQKQGNGIRPILDTIIELGEDIFGSVIGDKILGKASALLCVYSKVKGVYSTQATKTAIAVLIRARIPGQTDEIIPYIKNKNGNDICPFEKMLVDIETPDDAYKILKEKLIRD
jgi:hypothetical protein